VYEPLSLNEQLVELDVPAAVYVSGSGLPSQLNP
jgi:hypothetical protein